MNRLTDLSVDMFQGKLDTSKLFACKDGFGALADKYLDEASGMIELALYQGLISPEVHTVYCEHIVEARSFAKAEKQRFKEAKS